MRSLEIVEIHEIAFAAGYALERDEVGEGADWSLDAVDSPHVGAIQHLLEAKRRLALGEKVELSVRGCEMDRPTRRDHVVGDGRSVGARSWPLSDKSAQPLQVCGFRRENGIDVASCADYPVPYERDPSDEYVAHAGAVQVGEDLTEVAHSGA